MERSIVAGCRVGQRLGLGAMGAVWSATLTEAVGDYPIGSPVALKLLHPHLARQPDAVARFEREGHAGLAVRHRNVVATLRRGETPTDPVVNYLILEYVAGETLAELLARERRVPEALCRRIGIELARALDAIHAAGWIHRDVKPENVLITVDHAVKLMDLGVARPIDADGSAADAFAGSPAYAAPEQLRNDSDVLDGRMDLFSLGVLLYELASGQHPFESQSEAELIRRLLEDEPLALGERNPQVSAFFEELVHLLISKDPAARVSTARELCDVIEAAERGEWWRERSAGIRRRTSRPARRSRIERTTAIVGRGDELSTIQTEFISARGGAGRTLLVRGEAGIGKSRLLDEALDRVRGLGSEPTVVHVGFAPGDSVAHGFAQALREQLWEDALDEELAALLPELQPLLPSFAAFLRGASGPGSADVLDRASLDTCVVALVRAFAADRPTIVCVEDLHYAPADGRALFAAVAAAIAADRVLLLATARPTLPAQFVSDLLRQSHVRALTLERLDSTDVARLLTAALASEDLGEDLAATVMERSDGNPFFALEIVRALVDRGVLARSEQGAWVRAGRISEVEIPPTVALLIRARLADLEPSHRELLDVAACYGYEFDPVVVAAAAGGRYLRVLRLLAALEGKRLVRGVGDRFRFDHHQLQEIVYTALAPERRAGCHVRIGERLEADVGGPDCDLDCVPSGAAAPICWQFLAGDEAGRAERYLDRACGDLEHSHRHAALAELLTRALAAPRLLEADRRADALVRHAQALNEFAPRAEQLPLLEEAVALATKGGALPTVERAQRSLARLLLLSGRADESRTLLADLLARAEAGRDLIVQSQTLALLGQLQAQSGEAAEALSSLERARDLAERAGAVGEAASARAKFAIVHMMLGRMELAHDECRTAVEKFREAGDDQGAWIASINLAISLRWLGRLDESLALFEAALEYFSSRGQRPRATETVGNIGSLLLALGRLEDALARLDRVLVLASELGDDGAATYAHLNRSQVLLSLGRLTAARESIDAAIERCRSLGLARELSDARLLSASWSLVVGDSGAARAELNELYAAAEVGGDQRLVAYAISGMARAYEDAGETVEARSAAARACACFAALPPNAHHLGPWVAAAGVLTRTEPGTDSEVMLDRVSTAATQLNTPEAQLLCSAYRLRLPDGDASSVRRRLESVGDAVPIQTALRARYELWLAAGDNADRERAQQLLARLRDAAPAQRQDALCRGVALHAAIGLPGRD